MKSSRKLALAAGILLGSAALSFGELAQWVQHIAAGSPLEAVFFRTVTMPNGPIQSRKPPREVVAELTKQLAAAPGRADLLALRAQEAELNLDFTTAEQDWRAYARLATDKVEGAIALADYHHRRLQPEQELQALIEAAAQPSTGRDALNPEPQQRSWKTFERAIALADAQALPIEATESVYNAWIARYPARTEPYRNLFEFLVARQQPTRAQQQIDRYVKAFPQDQGFALQARAQLASPEEALKIYEGSFKPVMSPDVIARYFELLNRTRNLRTYLANARSAATANPSDLLPAAKLFYYYQQGGNLAEAHRALLEYRLRRPQPTPDELASIATLFEQTNNFAEAAKAYYDLSRTQSPQAEAGYAGLIRILFTAPEQSLPLGAGDISFYKDIATLDPYPGALNGMLSLLFNSTDPQWRYSDQQRAAIPYFHRLKAAELLQEMARRFPQSRELPSLQSMLLEAYAKHGEDEEVVRRGQQFLSANPNSPVRTTVSLLIADAHARRNRAPQEFAVYDALLKELADSVANVPLGTATNDLPPAPPQPNQEPSSEPLRRPVAARSATYAQVLDRYINRLVTLKRVPDALALYRREIDRNPNDPGLYERLAEFLSQNRLAPQIEALYKRAMAQFPDRSWHHKLARWYLRQNQKAAFDTLTKSTVGTFSGSELDAYFQQVVAGAGLDEALYKQVNLYAHQRFPHDLIFVKNLLTAYSNRTTRDDAASLALLRANWYHDPELRARFFERLSSTGRLDAEIAALRSTSAITLADRAATQLIATGEIWRSHFESAAPVMQTLAMSYPAHRELNSDAASLYRSMGQIDTAARIAERLARSEPRNLQAVTRVGEIYADREQFDKARPIWNRLPQIEPGRPEGYLEAATVFWDYYQFDDALRVIEEGRTKLHSSNLLAYEAGAIYENKRDYARAITEYLRGAQADPESPSRRRLVRLASRPAHRNTIEAQTQSLATGANPSLNGWNLRVIILEEQNRRDDIAALLNATLRATSNFDLLARVEQVADRNGFPVIREQTLARQATLTRDPVEKTRLQLTLARLAQERGDAAAAQQSIAAAYKENPNIVGVVRSAVDYYWRANDRKKAIDTLEEAAARSNPDFKRSFTLEAARKSTEAADYARARRLLQPLLTAEPLASDLVAANADTYARAGDDAGLRAFYIDRLKLARTPDEQAAIRRGLLPVLTRMKEHAAAVDEYIAILNRFPEDEALAGEAARYARKYNVADRLTAFYTKAVADSPRDPRWPMVLARTHTALESLPSAIDSYSKALTIRPDRSDLLASRAALEERLLRFEEAAASYAKLYELAYKDPQYMVKVAETRARLGQKDQAIAALRTAFIEGKSAKADAYLEIATKLEQWNWLTEARQYVADARKLDANQGAYLEARVAARLRSYETLQTEEALPVIAEVVRELYTPEEKATFAAWLTKLQLPSKWRFAAAAGLEDVAARELNANLRSEEELQQNLINTQQARLRYAELAGQLERFAATKLPGEASAVLSLAAQNWKLAVNAREELRVRDKLSRDVDPLRYGQLLLAAAPDRFVNSGLTEVAYRIATPDITLRMIGALSTQKPPVWNKAYTALTGVYFKDKRPAVTTAFEGVLGARTVGEQIAAKADRNAVAVGDVWFYYGARYGEFANSEEFLASELEGRPASADSYLSVGDHYRDAKNYARALEEYNHALQINPRSPHAHNRLAEIYIEQNKPAEAQQHLRQAIQLWSELQDARVPEEFWAGLSTTIQRGGPALRPDVDKLLRTYVRRNGTYRFDELLGAILRASPTSADTVRWISELSSAAKDPADFLASLANNPIFAPGDRELLYAKLLDLARIDAERKAGDARNDAQYRLQDYTARYIASLLDSKQYDKARTVIVALPPETRRSMNYSLTPLEIRLAAATNQIDTILRREDIDTERLKQGAAMLRQQGDTASAQRLLEALYTRELDANNLDASNFLGLAEVKLETGDVTGAVALLRRMAITSTEPFDTLAPAASLLDRFNRKTEALEFWQRRAKAVPWDLDAAVSLARAANDTQALRGIAANTHAKYDTRADAANALNATGLGSAELDLLASSTPITVAAAERPYFHHARVKAASQIPDNTARIRLLRGAIAIRPAPVAPRVQLFRTLFDTNQFEHAVAVFRNQLPDDQTALARDFATALRRSGDLQQARRFFNLAGATTEIASIDAELARIAENERRAPKVHENLDQPEKVRPRV
ncbi:MAG TPA: tetratricopeptide repeat protein [Bryobacteraceae bacterium]|nr:tetratricopeptide repeat protein [Bryobacteraceae bacterium]